MELSLIEIACIAFVGLLLYGGRLPQVALAVGRALGEFKKGLKETSDLVRYEVDDLGLDDRSILDPEPRRRTFPPRRGDRTAPTEERAAEAPAEPTDEELATEDITLVDPKDEAPEPEHG